MTRLRSTSAARLGVVALAALSALALGGSAITFAAPGGSAAPATATTDRNLGSRGGPASPLADSDPAAELIWQGQIHLGDQPGVYGGAEDPGITAELPLTLQQTTDAGPTTTTLIVNTSDVQTFAGYPGHLITVTLFVPDPAHPFHANPVVLARARLTSADNNEKRVLINLAGRTAPFYLGVRVQVDTDVPGGLLDDFLLTRLSNLSPDFKYVASFGFLPPN
jgi:hypothetical protein